MTELKQRAQGIPQAGESKTDGGQSNYKVNTASDVLPSKFPESWLGFRIDMFFQGFPQGNSEALFLPFHSAGGAI